jgi:hypothetical protein
VNEESFLPVGGLLAVCGRLAVLGRSSDDNGLVGFRGGLAGVGCGWSFCSCTANISPSGARRLELGDPGLELPKLITDCLCFNLASVAFNRASKASSSDVWLETALFLERS